MYVTVAIYGCNIMDHIGDRISQNVHSSSLLRTFTGELIAETECRKPVPTDGLTVL